MGKKNQQQLPYKPQKAVVGAKNIKQIQLKRLQPSNHPGNVNQSAAAKKLKAKKQTATQAHIKLRKALQQLKAAQKQVVKVAKNGKPASQTGGNQKQKGQGKPNKPVEVAKNGKPTSESGGNPKQKNQGKPNELTKNGKPASQKQIIQGKPNKSTWVVKNGKPASQSGGKQKYKYQGRPNKSKMKQYWKKRKGK